MTCSANNPNHAPRSQRGVLALLGVLAALTLSGCAAITNPLANGVPVHMVPDELLTTSKEDFEQTDLTKLRQAPVDVFKLAPGDTLGVYVEGVIGNAEVPPPVNLPDTADLPPSIGYPFPIRSDGTISLPFVGSVKVAGLTIEEAESKVVDMFLQKAILRPKDYRIVVTLMRPRHVRVLVIREDSPQSQISLRNESFIGLGSTQTTIGGGQRATGQVLELPAYENDVLNALARSGGLPGLESTQEIIIYRGIWDAAGDGAAAAAIASSGDEQVRNLKGSRIVRIPLRSKKGQPVSVNPEDVILQTGDIVTIRGRKPEFYYTGGLLPASETPMPANYDLTVVEAVLKARGPLLNGGFNASNLNGAVIGAGVGNPSPSQLNVLRKLPNGQQINIRIDLNDAVRDPRQNILVQSEDVLVLQENTDEAISRWFSQQFRWNFFGRYLNSTDAQGTFNTNLP